jgi:histidine ammonia-lyase
LELGVRSLTIEDVLALARGSVEAEIDANPEHRARLRRSRDVVDSAGPSDRRIYGVNTGVGASAVNAIPESQQALLPHRLLRFHGVGTGRFLDATEAAAVVAIRVATLARGHSGVRIELLDRMCALLNKRVLPRIPEEGSVGASGDLTPLSYLGSLLIGEREALLHDRVLPAADALAARDLAPLTLAPKESLALMNGTSVMTAIACLCFERAERLARLAAAVTAIVVDVTHGNREHFDPRLDAAKPHPGQRACAPPG